MSVTVKNLRIQMRMNVSEVETELDRVFARTSTRPLLLLKIKSLQRTIHAMANKIRKWEEPE